MWNLSSPPGFQGLREDLPLHTYVRHLPHWRQDGASYFLTFRLADSLPASKLEELAEIKIEWEARNPEPRSNESLEELGRISFVKIENWLDQGHGACILKQPDFAKLIVAPLHHFDDVRYELDCYVVMPNHVHAIVRPTEPPSHSLESILKSWKSHSSRRIHDIKKQSGALWQEESFDRIIRDEEHLWRTIQYIGRNPKKAGLIPGSCPLWIRPEWELLGWRFCE